MHNLPGQYITAALRQRLHELCTRRTQAIIPAQYGEMSAFVSQVRERLESLRHEEPDFLAQYPTWKAPASWLKTDDDCLGSIRKLSLCDDLSVYTDAGGSPPAQFIQTLLECRQNPERRVELLLERYSYPINISLDSEEMIREHLLERLMVQDRLKAGRNGAHELDNDDFLLRLNLVAVNAAMTQDLRYLDALNYYYEQLPWDWNPSCRNSFLLVSYLALYAHALFSQLKMVDECV